MRTVRGPSERVVVVGSGLAGLAAALHLAGAGRDVTVLEAADGPGGLARPLELDGYRFDGGPTVLTLPHLVEAALGCVGERAADWLTLHRLDPAYRAHFPDGATLDVRADPAATEAEIERVCGEGEAAAYRRFLDYLGRLYRVQMRSFIDRNLDSPLALVGPDLARLVALGGFRRLAPKVAGYFRDPRLQRLFSFQALYAGLSPQRALALYAVIAYMDTVAGVYFPDGGIAAVPQALAGAAAKHGVTFRYGTRVSGLERRGARVVAVHTTDGERVPADVVVLAGERERMGELAGERPRRLRHSPSCVLLHVGSRAGYSRIAHHNVHFGRAWRGAFRELVDEQTLMSDPSLLVTCATRTDPTLAPVGRSTYYVLLPVPHLGGGQDWSVLGPRVREELYGRCEALGYRGFADAVEVSALTTPADWAVRGLPAGTPFSAAHTFGQTGPFRPPNLLGDNVVLAGAGTHPGVGVPTVLISGRLAAERVLGR